MNDKLRYHAIRSERLWNFHERPRMWQVRFGKLKARFFWTRRGPR